MTEPVDLLAFGAHPDDAEIGCGGVLASVAESGARVAIVDATAGEAATHGSVEAREKERLLAADVLGLCARPVLGLKDTRIGEDPRDLDAIVAILRAYRPRIVLAPFAEDRHPDHAALGRLVRDASFLAGVGNLAAPQRVYHYMIHHPFIPSFVVDVSGTWNRKMEAVRCHESQFGAAATTELSPPAFLEVLEARGTYYGSLVGAARGEPFWSPGPVPVSSLPDLEGARRYSAFR